MCDTAMEQRPNLGFLCVALKASVAAFVALMLSGCANEEAFLAIDHAKCRQLGFTPGSADYNTCISQVARRRTNLAAVPEPLREDYTAVPPVPAEPKGHQLRQP
jgi:hypothetical protein